MHLQSQVRMGFEFEFISPMWFNWTYLFSKYNITKDNTISLSELDERDRALFEGLTIPLAKIAIAINPTQSKSLQSQGFYILLPDMSVARNNNIGWEIVTQPTTYKEALSELEAILKWLSKSSMRTANSTGLHVGLSLQNIDLTKQLNILKLITLFDLDKIYADMPSRKGNRFVISYKDLNNLKNLLPGLIREHASKGAEKLDEHFMKHITPKTTKAYGKDFTVNFLHLLKHNYVEFRVLGGQDYPSKLESIEQAIEHFIDCLVNAISESGGEGYYYYSKLESFIQKCTKPVVKGIF